MSGTLYLVATPIGNLGDFSPRAKQALSEADFIAAEDTRVTLKLLNHFGIKKPLISYFEHNRATSGEKILSRLLSGESAALVTDAGTPAISDPGADLVALCAQSGVTIIAIPGACAAISALALSGLDTSRFAFEGFLNTTGRKRAERLKELSGEKRTLVLYEAPHKLVSTLSDLVSALGSDRRVALCRELTKLHEETVRTTLAGALERYTLEAPRGEFVLVIEGAPEKTTPEVSLERAKELVYSRREAGLSLKESARLISEETGYSKNELYNACLKERELP
ncbi:MAG: 16S rRNA (cytidine(1402)-2'-O)-methyltransferase [Oscillospiraceae bacterium]|jgi:16S rRNA (cytidine1402-2'-O)-methyltransferase|nr:16S rRNA (cytidine(1402)-2'-O)-methyltransferase [Oscillospiraceae bacterium]